MSDRTLTLHPLLTMPLDAVPATDEVFLINGDDRWSYRRLGRAVDCLAAGLVAWGVRPGDRIALHLRTGPEMATAYLACFRIGAIAAPLNLRFKHAELVDVLQQLRPILYIGHSDLYRHVAATDAAVLAADARFVVDETDAATALPWAELQCDPDAAPRPGRADPNAPALLLLTSGTTGRPKFVAHSLSTLTAIADRFAALGMRRGCKLPFFLPMVHASGLTVFLAALRLRMQLILCDAADPDAILDVIEAHRCDRLMSLPITAPPLVEAQRRRPRDVSSLHLCLTAGDAPQPGLQDAFEAAFGRPLRSFWAASETIGSLTFAPRSGPVSRPVPGAEIMIVDDRGNPVVRGETGEMMLRGPNVTPGYWRAPGVIDRPEGGWYRSGDLMRQDADGLLWFVARLKDLIVRGGSNISPVEVEGVVGAHPAVEEAAVVGVADATLGQRVVGFVRLKPGAGPGVLPEILAQARERLADYKVPEQLLRVAAVPRNALGKVDRKALAAVAEPAFESGSAYAGRPSTEWV